VLGKCGGGPRRVDDFEVSDSKEGTAGCRVGPADPLPDLLGFGGMD
jgi:hypothetical protein